MSNSMDERKLVPYIIGTLSEEDRSEVYGKVLDGIKNRQKALLDAKSGSIEINQCDIPLVCDYPGIDFTSFGGKQLTYKPNGSNECEED